MTKIRWMITLLPLSILLSGCGMTGNFPDEEPSLIPTEPTAVEPTQVPTETEAPDLEPAAPLGEEPPALYVLLGDIASPMERGSYCWSITDEGGICVDVFAFPIFYPEDRYTEVIGNTLELLFDAPFPDTVNASLYPDPGLMPDASIVDVEAVMDENGGVLVTVPGEVNGYYALAIFATWAEGSLPYGDASYSAPVRFGQ